MKMFTNCMILIIFCFSLLCNNNLIECAVHQVGVFGYKSIYLDAPRLANVDTSVGAQLPTEFDARQKWPECSSVIGKISDQGSCGSCWAVSSTDTMSDRICIASGGKVKIHISVMDLMECCGVGPGLCADGSYENEGGCQGGDQYGAWKWFAEHGLVTGGRDDDDTGCKPYPEDPPQQANLTCIQQCENPAYPVPYSKDRHYATSFYKLPRDEITIMNEIYTNGPVTAGFDAEHIGKLPIVECPTLQNSTHSIRIVGWGELDGVKYWHIANSWGTGWGVDGGFFKILRGVNSCGIEDEVVSGIAQLN